jgi:CheY-like chemotaxis protein
MSAKILIVDDEHFVRDLLVKILRKQGHDVRWAACAPEALALLETELPDLVITDVVMPGMDGFELLRRIKGSHPTVKVVVLTGFARRQSISDFLLYGADGYLAKPFQVAELIQLVDRATAKPVRV